MDRSVSKTYEECQRMMVYMHNITCNGRYKAVAAHQILLTKEAAAGRMFWRFLPFYPLLHLVHSDGQPLVLIVTGITSLRSLVGLCLFD